MGSHPRLTRRLAATMVSLAMFALCSGCDSPAEGLRKVMSLAGLSSPETEQLAAQFEDACEHYLACAEQSAEPTDREQLQELAQLCEASGVLVGMIALVGDDCRTAAEQYVHCVLGTSCAELTAEGSPKQACADALERLKAECEPGEKPGDASP